MKRSRGIDAEEAMSWLAAKDEAKLSALFSLAAAARRDAFGDTVTFCSIVNARCGHCSENCAFCAQSSRSRAKIDKYPLLGADEIVGAAARAEGVAARFGIVTSGRSMNFSAELDTLMTAIGRISRETRISPCASLGILSADTLRALKNAGLKRYHHNLETARSFFPTICSTRSYDDQIAAVMAAQEVGLPVCSGGIFGLGETPAQRVELLETVRTLEVDSVPINFLTPIPGTPLENIDNGLTPMECLKIVAVARLMMPDRTIPLCGGRERNLRDFQSWIFAAGANGLMTGGYLTTPGRSSEEDAAMVRDAGARLSLQGD